MHDVWNLTTAICRQRPAKASRPSGRSGRVTSGRLTSGVHENQRMLGGPVVVVASHGLSPASDPALPTRAPVFTNLRAQQQEAHDDYGLSLCAGCARIVS